MLESCCSPIIEPLSVRLDVDVMLNNNPVSKRFTVTVPDSVFEELENWADCQGRPTANLAAYLIEAGIRQAKLEGEYKTLKKQFPSPKDKGATNDPIN